MARTRSGPPAWGVLLAQNDSAPCRSEDAASSFEAMSARACGVHAPAKPGRGLENGLLPKAELADENVAMRGACVGLRMLLTADAEASSGAPAPTGLSTGDTQPRLEALDHVRASPRRAASSSSSCMRRCAP